MASSHKSWLFMKLHLRTKYFSYFIINILFFIYPTLIRLMFTANIMVIWPYPYLFNSIWWQYHLVTPSPCIWLVNNSSMELTPLSYSPWVNLYFFTINMYKHCFLPLILVVLMKWYCTICFQLHCSLPHNPYCCSLPLPYVCSLQLPICTCLNSSPIACPPPYLCYLDVYCVCTL